MIPLTTLSVLDSRTGNALSVHALADYPGIIAVDEGAGHALIGGFAQPELRLVETLTGATLATVATPSPLQGIAVDGRRHRAFVLTATGIAVVDTRTGAILRSLPQVAGASRLVADAHSGRVLLATDASRLLPARSGQRHAFQVNPAKAWILGEGL